MDNLLEHLRDLRVTSIATYYRIRDTEEQSDEGVYRASSGRVLRAGASVPVKFGSTTLPGYGCIQHLVLSPMPQGYLWRLHQTGMRLFSRLVMSDYL